MNGQNYNKNHTKPHPAVFVFVTLIFFCLSLSAAESVGFVPYFIDGTEPSLERRALALSNIPQLGNEPVAAQTATPVVPAKLTIASIGLDLAIQNPETRDMHELDEALKYGPVRYVDSAKLNEKGNMFVFAHSSHLPIVHNQMFKAFNRINELKEGDLITIEGGGEKHIYRVSVVRLTDANEEMIDLSPTREPKLTLSTCDNFGGKTSRWVVEADFMASYPVDAL